MHGPARVQFSVHLVGGIAVLGSYAWGLATHPGQGPALWGDIPQAVRGAYSASMPFAAVGYLVTMGFVLARVPRRPDLPGGYGGLTAAFAVLLACSAAWMPLCFAALGGTTGLFWPIQVVLAGTAGASLWLLWALWQLRPHGPRGWWRACLLGWLAFCWQTVVLDAIVWPRFFPV